MIREITATELAAWLADDSRPQPYLLDVREDWEFALCRIAGSQQLPMHLLPLRHSFQSGLFLNNAGFEEVLSLRGGVAAWADDVEPGMARY